MLPHSCLGLDSIRMGAGPMVCIVKALSRASRAGADRSDVDSQTGLGQLAAQTHSPSTARNHDQSGPLYAICAGGRS